MKKRPDGRYQKKITLHDGRAKIIYGRTKAEIAQKEQAIRAKEQMGLVLDHEVFGTFAHTWIQTYKAGVRANTLESYKRIYNLHIYPYLGAMQFKDIKPIHCQRVMAAVAGKSQSLQHKTLITMKQILEAARQNNYIVLNPADGLKIGKTPKQEKKKYLTKNEADHLAAALVSLEDKRAAAFAGLCLYCGLRREEALGLMWTDISGNVLTVRRAKTFIKNRTDPVMEVKSRSSLRSVPMPDQLISLLENTPKTSLYVVPAADGGDITQTAFRYLWSKVRDAVPFYVTPHMLRHTYCTSLYRAGVDVRTAQKLLGHSSITMTANIYTHIEQDDALEVGNVLNDYFLTTSNCYPILPNVALNVENA